MCLRLCSDGSRSCLCPGSSGRGLQKDPRGTPAPSPLCCGCGRDFGDTLKPDSAFPRLRDHSFGRVPLQAPNPIQVQPQPSPFPSPSPPGAPKPWHQWWGQKCRPSGSWPFLAPLVGNTAPRTPRAGLAHGSCLLGTLQLTYGLLLLPSLLVPAALARVRTEPEPSQARSREGSRPKKFRSLMTRDHSHGSPSWRWQPVMSGSPGSHMPELGLNSGDQAELFCLFVLFFFFKLRHSKHKLKPPRHPPEPSHWL